MFLPPRVRSTRLKSRHAQRLRLPGPHHQHIPSPHPSTPQLTPRRHDCGRSAIIQRSRRLELPFSVNSGGGGVAFFSLLYSRGVVPVLERK